MWVVGWGGCGAGALWCAGRMVSAGRLDGVMEMRGGKSKSKVKDTEIEE